MSNNPPKPGPPIAPHPPLLRYYHQGRQREPFVQGLFDRTAGAYDSINSWASVGLGSWYRRRTLRMAGVKPGMCVLDVAIGTGLVARQAVRVVAPDGFVIGIDSSFGMLTEARKRLAIPLLQGRAEQLPLGDGSVDVVTMGYALRHVADLAGTFAEFRRVLRPGGRVLLLEIVRPKGRFRHAVAETYLRRVVPVLARLTTGRGETEILMRYFWDTIEHCVPAETILRTMADAGLSEVREINELQVFATYVGCKA
jgi:demethylmenaquinone methyltransferase/2-methoxy-6-polyprenyl-1,4-benzoquinol methylase